MRLVSRSHKWCTLTLEDSCLAAREPVHNKMISGFQALRQAKMPVAGLEPARRIPTDIRADSLATVPPTPPDRIGV
ncbi:hypothetical protein PoB_004789300 [Plakobranchus ocellatus]|uniref:Uncharacterized protein n=1 Tax=Plakobranchus ocellatus TaxID=259542 RepID=A0AAV4BRE0_9GAST|nr:hypothetical protein PoB_004789300 [Plakobranchus ocellatus]